MDWYKLSHLLIFVSKKLLNLIPILRNVVTCCTLLHPYINCSLTHWSHNKTIEMQPLRSHKENFYPLNEVFSTPLIFPYFTPLFFFFFSLLSYFCTLPTRCLSFTWRQTSSWRHHLTFLFVPAKSSIFDPKKHRTFSFPINYFFLDFFSLLPLLRCRKKNDFCLSCEVFLLLPVFL